jgi:hypothetical protein
MLAAFDKAGFQGPGIRHADRFLEACGARLSAVDREVIANDIALLHFHRGDDVGCIKALAESAIAAGGGRTSTAFNRALCGGACTATDESTCSSAARARQNALSARDRQAEALEAVRKSCAPGAGVVEEYVLAADMKKVLALEFGGSFISRVRLHWAGDLNGDGLGDLILGPQSVGLTPAFDPVSVADREEAWEKHKRGTDKPSDWDFANADVGYEAFLGCDGAGKFVRTWEGKADKVTIDAPDADGARRICFVDLTGDEDCTAAQPGASTE